jgi:hypothetical protein
MREVHTLGSPHSTDAPPRSSLPAGKWLPLGEVALAVASGAASWPQQNERGHEKREDPRG